MTIQQVNLPQHIPFHLIKLRVHAVFLLLDAFTLTLCSRTLSCSELQHFQIKLAGSTFFCHQAAISIIATSWGQIYAARLLLPFPLAKLFQKINGLLLSYTSHTFGCKFCEHSKPFHISSREQNWDQLPHALMWALLAGKICNSADRV